MNHKALLGAAVVLTLALSPSITECVMVHEEQPHRRWLLWGWLALLVIVAFVAGEELLGSGGG